MKSIIVLLFFVASFLLLGVFPACTRKDIPPLSRISPTSDSPADCAYLLNNRWVQLKDGQAEWQAAPGSASRAKVALAGGIAQGNLTYDTVKDVVLFLTYQEGGSGTFYYLAATVLENGKYRGTNTILLGDRIGSPVAEVQNGLITVKYLDRDRNEPMAAMPTVAQTRFFILDHFVLQEIIPAPGDKVLQGWLTIGHEVRSFLPCNEKDYLWLNGSPGGLKAITAEYYQTMAAFPPYTPAFTILTGRRTIPPQEGFGADYKEGLAASQIVRIWPRGNCRSDFILLDSPLPGAYISSPFTVTGRARGTWFFEGDFPVILLDAHCNTVSAGYATAKGEWMTEDFVRFEGTMNFTGTFRSMGGTLVLKKDNPTGQSRFDDFLEIPIHFK